ncbi:MULTISPECIES: ATP-binding protein [unclassified Sphingomonas]|uniref:sensor histidine kinase n=1 Tax=Novosphingobium rhizosphaerae TaxID=1551649 RepID=UPI0015C9CF05
MNSIVARLIALAGVMIAITMAVGLIAYYGAAYFHLQVMMKHMPPEARQELAGLIAHGQQASPRYFALFERYGSGALDISDAGFILAIGITSIVAGGTVAVLLARRISQPIIAVAEAAAAVAAGDRSVRVAKGRVSGEVGTLIDSFNRMASDIEAYERERTVFTAGVTHELRTPLTILKGRLHGIADGMVPASAAEADRLLRQVEHLGRIVEDLKTLAHADAGELALDRRNLMVDDVLRVCVTDLRGSAVAAEVEFAEHYAGGKVHGDAVRLSQIFLNLLTNAIKHAPVGSRIQVSSRTDGHRAIIEVIDAGGGFAPQDAQRLFMPFWRSRADKVAGRPGSGLGLALAEKLAEAHGGRIVASNRQDRSGAIFRVELPLAQA